MIAKAELNKHYWNEASQIFNNVKMIWRLMSDYADFIVIIEQYDVRLHTSLVLSV